MTTLSSTLAATLIALGIAAAGCTVEGRVRTRTVAGTTVATEAPPPPRVTQVPVRPGHVWVAGQWRLHDGRWLWQEGHWMRQRAGHVWVQGHWQARPEGHVYVQGRWERERPGYVYREGRWERDRQGRWVWQRGRWVDRSVVERGDVRDHRTR
jgi:hypothetical protein